MGVGSATRKAVRDSIIAIIICQLLPVLALLPTPERPLDPA
jgi:ABC-type transporter Mla maintaining outer membrane lipid asymmetry permease subunit MlaE